MLININFIYIYIYIYIHTHTYICIYIRNAGDVPNVSSQTIRPRENM
jgi:hypothetical protein